MTTKHTLDMELREARETATVRRWEKNGGYLVGVFSFDRRVPRVYHDETGDSLDDDERREGDENNGVVGGYAHDVLRDLGVGYDD